MQYSISKYLVKNGLATPDQIAEALDYQQIYGDRLESHLFRFGYVNETDLVGALAEQFGCPGAVLSNLDIPDAVLELIPANFVFSNLILPYAFDESSQTIRIACEDPRRNDLADDLKTVINDYNIELYVALDPVLRAAIVRHYRHEPIAVAEGQYDDTPEESIHIRDNFGIAPETTAEPDSSCQLLILDHDHETVDTLIPVLRYQGFNLTVEKSVDRFVQASTAMCPEMMLLAATGDHAEVAELIDRLQEGGVIFNQCPAFLITDELSQRDSTDLLVRGFEDVVRSKYILDFLMIKIRLVRERLAAEQQKRREFLRGLGTHGSIEDMSVLDLLQAMGTTGKNIQINVSGAGHQLTVFMAKGRVIFAESDDKVGAEAVYQALGWTQGVWSVDPVLPENLPEPNNQLTNEAILLEGCRRLDEKSRGLKDKASSDPIAILNSFDPPTARLL